MKKNKRGQRQFYNSLIKALLNMAYPEEEIPIKKHPHHKAMPLPNRDIQQHHWGKFLKRKYCVWCKEQAEKGLVKEARVVLGEIINDAGPKRRGGHSRTYGGCKGCNVSLCQKGACFRQYYSSSNAE
jgi:hypothetical protein